MQAIKAIYDGLNFMPMQPIPVKGKYEVVITFIKPVKKVNVKTGINVSAKMPRSTGRGLLKGKVWMSKEFNARLEEMKMDDKEYEDML